MVISFMGLSFSRGGLSRHDRTEARISSIAAESVRLSRAGGPGIRSELGPPPGPLFGNDLNRLGFLGSGPFSPAVMTPGGSMRFLLTSAGIKNTSIHDALVDLLGKPIAESNALCIPTAMY